MKPLLTVSLLLCITVFKAYAAPSENINISGKLIYLQNANQESYIISRASTNIQTYKVDSSKCTSISKNGTYLAITSMQREDLSIRRFDTQVTIRQLPWSSDWEPCSIYWISDTIIRIADSISTTKRYNLDVLTGIITVSEPTPYIEPTYPQLLDWIPGNGVLPSPDGSKYLYEKCPFVDRQTTPDGTNCKHYSDWFIYTSSGQPEFINLLDVSPISFQAYGFFAAASWSPNNRYLAYLREQWFPLRIYDTLTNQNSDTSGIADNQVDETKGLYWSPDGTKVAMWVVGRMDEPQTGDDNMTLRRLVIFDTTKNDSTRYIVADMPHNLARRLTYNPGKWSPDSQAFIYLNNEKQLIYMPLGSGETTILDENVIVTVAWVATE